jgi:hypothetical protein
MYRLLQERAWGCEFPGEERVVDLNYRMAGEDPGEFSRDFPVAITVLGRKMYKKASMPHCQIQNFM